MRTEVYRRLHRPWLPPLQQPGDFRVSLLSVHPGTLTMRQDFQYSLAACRQSFTGDLKYSACILLKTTTHIRDPHTGYITTGLLPSTQPHLRSTNHLAALVQSGIPVSMFAAISSILLTALAVIFCNQFVSRAVGLRRTATGTKFY